MSDTGKKAINEKEIKAEDLRSKPSEVFDPVSMVIYSEIMKPKWQEM